MALYVNMVDRFLSGWGEASQGKSRFSVKCDTEDQAYTIVFNALRRGDMRYIKISNKPPRKRKGDHIRIVDYTELGSSWKVR